VLDGRVHKGPELWNQKNEGKRMKYSITKKKCQENINKSGVVVCPGCGGKIVPIETVDNSHNPTFWRGCKKCMMFENGVRPEAFEIATKMVKDNYFRVYHDKEPDKANIDEYDYWLNCQMRGTGRIVNQVLHLFDKIKSQKELENLAKRLSENHAKMKGQLNVAKS